MNESPSVRGIEGIDLGDDMPGAFGGGLDDIHRDAVAAEAVFVGRRNLDERHVDGHGATAKKIRNIHQVHRSIIGAPFRYRFTGRRRHKKGFQAASFVETRFRVATLSQAEDV